MKRPSQQPTDDAGAVPLSRRGRMRESKRLPIGVRIALLCSIPLVIVVLVGTFVLNRRDLLDAIAHQREFAEVYVTQLGVHASTQVREKDLEQLEALVGEFSGPLEDLVGCHFEGPSGEFVYEWQRDERIIDWWGPGLGDTVVARSRILVEGEFCGTVAVAFDLEGIRASLEERRSHVMQGALLLMAAIGSICVFEGRRISRSISRLTEVTESYAEGEPSVAAPEGDDEIGRLGRTFNRMADRLDASRTELVDKVDQVEEANGRLQVEIDERTRAEEEQERLHHELIDASRQAGMAEVATGVLHNVGNVLNSVNISASQVLKKIGEARIADLERVSELVSGHEEDLGSFVTSDERGRLLPAFLGQMSSHLRGVHEEVANESRQLLDHIEHIKQIVSVQQSYARISCVHESIDASAPLADAIRINFAGLERHGIELTEEYEDVPLVNTDRHVILQILTNLISNAKHACSKSRARTRRIDIRIRNGAEGSTVCYEVEDNGIGIPEENLTKIFQHGFTTREDGHGFGLHTAALSARELGGALRAFSEGAQRGSLFVLEIPLEPSILKEAG